MCLCCLAGAKKKGVKKQQPIDLLLHTETDVAIHMFSLFSYLQHACCFFLILPKNRGGGAKIRELIYSVCAHIAGSKIFTVDNSMLTLKIWGWNLK